MKNVIVSVIVVLMLSIGTIATADQEQAPTYHSDSEFLFIPLVKVDSNYVGTVLLALTDNNNFKLLRADAIPTEQQNIYSRLNEVNCSPLANLERFAFYQKYIQAQPESTSCLSLGITTTVEAGKILHYLIILENEVVHFSDRSRDTFSACCGVINSTYTTVEFGYLEGETFINVDDVNQLDLSREHLLRLSNNEGEFADF